MAANSASYDWNDITTTTLLNKRGEFADNVSNHNSLLQYLKKKGNSDPATGGWQLIEELDYAENATFKYYSGYEILDTTPQETFSAAEFDWKQAAVTVSISGLEERQNMGENAVMKLLSKRIKNAERSMANNLSVGIFSNGTGSGSKQITGLQAAVPDDPTTGIYGGIDRGTYTFWASKLFDFSTNGLSASAATMQRAMNTLWLNTTRMGDHIDLFIAGLSYFEYFWESLQAIQRITDDQSAAPGFRSLKYNGPGGTASVIYDESCNTARMYGLNTDYIFWRPHSDANMVPLTRRNSFNQDAMVVPIIFMGNMTMSNASLQGVIIA